MKETRRGEKLTLGGGGAKKYERNTKRREAYARKNPCLIPRVISFGAWFVTKR